MTDSGQKPEYVFDGNYEHFPRTQRLLMRFTYQANQKQNDPADWRNTSSLHILFYAYVNLSR